MQVVTPESRSCALAGRLARAGASGERRPGRSGKQAGLRLPAIHLVPQGRCLLLRSRTLDSVGQQFKPQLHPLVAWP